MLGAPEPSACRILDVSAGIGTQALPLAALGYEVVARDLSPNSIRRLEREARARGLKIDAATADMRNVSESVVGPFDAVLAFDNSIPHLLTDGEIQAAFSEFSGLLAPQGRILVSVRDYSSVNREPSSYHDYGERVRDGHRFRLGQHWRWLNPTHYRTTMVVEEMRGESWTEVVRTEAEYYAIEIDRLLQLMQNANLVAELEDKIPFFQPVLSAGAG